MLDEQRIRRDFRRVPNPLDVFSQPSSYYLDEQGAIAGLNAADRGLTAISGLRSMLSLRFLDLSMNRIFDGSPLARLSELEQADLTFNELDDLSFALPLRKLKFLDVRNNRLRRLPQGFASLQMPIVERYEFRRFGLFLQGNPLEQPPMEVVRKGDGAARAYLSDAADVSSLLGEVRVVVMGEAGVGKSSLVRSICREEVVADHPAPGLSVRRRVPDPTESVRANIWELGGLITESEVHLLLLSARSIYVLIVDEAHSEYLELRLREISRLAPEAIVMVVMNRMDEFPYFDLNRAALRLSWPAIEGFYPLSALTGEGMSLFVGHLWRRAAESPIARKSVPASWRSAREELRQCADFLLTIDAFRAVCRRHGLSSEPEQLDLLTAALDLGDFVYLSPGPVDAHVVCNPGWFLEGLQIALEGLTASDSSGIAPQWAVRSSLTEKGYQELQAWFVVRLLCSPPVGAELADGRVVVPGLLGRLDEHGQVDPTGCVHVRIVTHLSSLRAVHAVIAMFPNDIIDREWGRHSARLSERVLGSDARITLDGKLEYVDLRTFGPRRREYMSNLRKAFRDHLQTAQPSSQSLVYEERLPLSPEEDYWMSFEEIGWRLASGEDSFVLPHTRRRIRLTEVIRRSELAAEESEGLQSLGPAPSASDRYCFLSFATDDRAFVDQLVANLGAVGMKVWESSQLQAGAVWSRDLEEKIRGCAIFLLVVTPASHASNWVRRELALAEAANRPVIPIEVERVRDWIEIAHLQSVAADKGLIRELYGLWFRSGGPQ